MFWKRKRSGRDFSEELRSHLELEADELKTEGLAPNEAPWAARRAMGNLTAAEERFYERGRLMWLDDLIRDAHYALRMMRRSPGFTAGTALLLALGIGANTAIYSFVEAILLRSLPVRDPQSLVLLKWRATKDPAVSRSFDGESHRDPALGIVSGNFPFPAFEFLGSDNQVLSGIFGFAGGGNLTVLANGSADRTGALFVSGQFFRSLNIVPALGRILEPVDDGAGAPAVAVLSHAWSKAHFGESANAIGQTILVNNQPFQVVGIAPEGFFGVDTGRNVQVYLPIRSFQSLRTQFVGNRNSMYRDEHWYWIQVMGRLRPGVTMPQAEAALAASFAGWVGNTASTDREKATLPTLYLQEGASGLDFQRYSFSKPLFLLMAMAGLILAIACANVANLLLARAVARRREIALRLGLGGGRWRISRQLLTESVLLSALGGAFGILFAWAGMRGLSALLDVWQHGTTFRVEVNWSFLIVSAALALLTGLLFGVAPAIQSSRVQPGPGLKEVRIGGPATWLGRMFPGSGLKNGLVAIQIAISLTLLAGAFLFVRTVSNLQSVRLGFNQDNLLLFDVDAKQAGYQGEALGRFYDQAVSQLRSIPGVQTATIASYALVAGSRSGTGISVPGETASSNKSTAVVWVGPDFLTTMQIPLVYGGDLSDRDTRSARVVAVINEAFAARHFPDRNPVGEQIRFNDPENALATIVGVARNSLLTSLKQEIEPLVLFAYPQHLARISNMTFVARTATNPAAVAGSARRVLAAVDSRVPVTNIRTQAAQIRQTIGLERLFASLCSAFAILALVIASVGVYGTLAYSVSRRTGEIGIRVALGARRGQIVTLILRESLLMIAVGLALGVPLVWGASHFIQSFLFGAPPTDPIALSAAAISLVTSATIAGLLPAWRAARLDPTVSLRHE
jgi:predicted permease